jgi:hypothetical protein
MNIFDFLRKGKHDFLATAPKRDALDGMKSDFVKEHL